MIRIDRTSWSGFLYLHKVNPSSFNLTAVRTRIYEQREPEIIFKHAHKVWVCVKCSKDLAARACYACWDTFINCCRGSVVLVWHVPQNTVTTCSDLHQPISSSNRRITSMRPLIERPSDSKWTSIRFTCMGFSNFSVIDRKGQTLEGGNLEISLQNRRYFLRFAGSARARIKHAASGVGGGGTRRARPQNAKTITPVLQATWNVLIV